MNSPVKHSHWIQPPQTCTSTNNQPVMGDFRILLRFRWHLRYSGILCSVEW
jgi:hypothetical protein